MTEQQSLLRTILEWPDDNACRLVYADWLTENGQHERAFTLRWFLERPEYRQSVPIREFIPMLTRYDISGEVCGVWNRGFGAEIRLPCAAFMQHAADLFASHPITAVRLTDKEPMEWAADTGRWTPPAFTYTWEPGADGYRYGLPKEIIESERSPRFETVDDAHKWASRKAVAYGRQLAGLRPLETAEPVAA